MNKLFVCGRNSVFDLLSNNYPFKQIIVNSEALAKKVSELKKNEQLNIIVGDKLLFEKYNNENHQGIIAFIDNFEYKQLEIIKKDKPKLILILDHIQDPHNLGAIIRSANAFGVKHIIINKDRSCDVTPTVLKVSSGGFIGMNIIKVANLVASIKKLKQWGFWIYASSLSNKACPSHETSYSKPTALIIGNEQKGIASPVLNESDQLIYIKQNGTVQSLNASVATGILLHDICSLNNTKQ
ncbi:23S rRNA (guanosine(2251)-2'-O)-methyltransferase RlmB [Mycoplasma sp. Mirounga ES2805-ORL]|nr:23S rRNA (guanosine(2251)-2'-O)-methyltransferase RlmB [Mycoplasma sp. Mirounga ES2805-ORL]QSF14003.1 23S rRNA (guanosine(2251)-2'-O)-methyltransferase RlmB [Mycoplasma sp. Mirounga ES2805-ORL]